MKYENVAGKKVRCVRAWKQIGLRRGETYTLALKTDGIYLSAGDLAEGVSNTLRETGPTAPHRIAVKSSGMVQFATPKVVVAELFPYFLDADRFEAI